MSKADFFSISKRNRRGIFILILCCLLIAIAPRILTAAYSVKKPVISFEEAKKIHLEIQVKKSKAKKQKRNYNKNRFTKPKSKFDPKNYKASDWMKLGLSQKQSEVVVKFASRGIANEGELERIFVIPNDLFLLIKDSVIYTTRENGYTSLNKPKEKKIEIVDINQCTQQDLENLPGIGKYFATKIIEYRNTLGGYTSTSQLLEIWNFDNEKFERITPYITKSSVVNKININSATLEELKQHPYISYGVANSIVKMRAQSKFNTVEDIKRSKLIDQELFEKIEPYLECK